MSEAASRSWLFLVVGGLHAEIFGPLQAVDADVSMLQLPHALHLDVKYGRTVRARYSRTQPPSISLQTWITALFFIPNCMSLVSLSHHNSDFVQVPHLLSRIVVRDPPAIQEEAEGEHIGLSVTRVMAHSVLHLVRAGGHDAGDLPVRVLEEQAHELLALRRVRAWEWDVAVVFRTVGAGVAGLLARGAA